MPVQETASGNLEAHPRVGYSMKRVCTGRALGGGRPETRAKPDILSRDVSTDQRVPFNGSAVQASGDSLSLNHSKTCPERSILKDLRRRLRAP
jgi:hypothetical protein